MKIFGNLLVATLLLSLPYTYKAQSVFENIQAPQVVDPLQTKQNSEAVRMKDLEYATTFRFSDVECQFGMEEAIKSQHEVKGMKVNCKGRYSFKRTSGSNQEQEESDFSVNVDNVDFKVTKVWKNGKEATLGQTYHLEKP